jgi:hypothetical protein
MVEIIPDIRRHRIKSAVNHPVGSTFRDGSVAVRIEFGEGKVIGWGCLSSDKCKTCRDEGFCAMRRPPQEIK